MRSFFTHDAVLGAGARRRADGVGHQPRAARHRARRADVRHAPRRPASGGRSAAAAHSPRRSRAAVVPPRRRGAHRQHGRRRSCCDGTRAIGVALARRHGDHGAGRRVGMRSAAHVRAVAAARRRPGATAMIERWRGPRDRRGLRVEDRRRRRPRAAAPRQRALACRRRSRSPRSIAEMDRAATLLPSGGILERPALLVNVPSHRRPVRWRPPGRHVLQPRGAADAVPPSRRVAGIGRAQTLAGAVRRLVRAGVPRLDRRLAGDDTGRLRARLPPPGRATPRASAGGPLAALRHRDPELTRYETAVPGLYLTGAATFPGAGIWGASGRNCATVVLARAR